MNHPNPACSGTDRSELSKEWRRASACATPHRDHDASSPLHTPQSPPHNSFNSLAKRPPALRKKIPSVRVGRHDRIPPPADAALHSSDIPVTSPVPVPLPLPLPIPVATVLPAPIIASPVAAPVTLIAVIPLVSDAVVRARAGYVSVTIVALVPLARVDRIAGGRVTTVRLIAAASLIQDISIAVTAVTVVVADVRRFSVLRAY
jgi:hypothetical protein